MDNIFKALCILTGIVMIFFYAKRKHTVRSAATGMLLGGAALIACHYFGGYVGYSPPVNLFNTGVSLIMGIPGAALIMAINIFF